MASMARNGLIHPCDKDCENRHAGCHASCERWAEYISKRDALYAQRVEFEQVVAARQNIARRINKIWRKGRQ